MKHTLNRLKLLVLTGLAAAFALVDQAVDKCVVPILNVMFPPRTVFGPKMHQAGYVTLSRPTQGYLAGQTVELTASAEAAMIASGGATASAGPSTAGNLTTTATQGSSTVAAGQPGVTIFNSLITPQTILYAVVCQFAADTTFTNVARVVCNAGSATVYGNANATAAVAIDWAIINPSGTLTSPY